MTAKEKTPDDRPLAADLYCGLGGWTTGLIAEGWRVRGYDIEEHVYGDERYPGEFVLRDILEMHGREVADADLIVSSSPCTDYSYMAMPFSRGRLIAAALRGQADFPENYRGPITVDKLNALFDAQFRIQREASEAKGEWIPMVAENVRGAQEWVGGARANYGSYYLWGDVPALLPEALGDGRKAAGKGDCFSTYGTGWPRDHAYGSSARKAASAKIAKIPEALSRHIARIYLPGGMYAPPRP